MDWTALLKLGLQGLQLHPRDFWALTPVELMLMAGLGDGGAVLDRPRFEALAAEWPDRPDKGVDDGRD